MAIENEPAEDSEKSEDDTLDEGDKALLETAKRRFRLAAEAERDIRLRAHEDFEFRSGKQWPDDVLAARTQDKRPSLVINRIPQFVHQITNEWRQNRPAVKVSPVDDTTDVDTARVRQGLIRHIEQDSNADIAYDTAFDHAVTGGLGYFRILTEYSDPMSFDQDIKIKRIPDWSSAYLDPSYKEPDGSDADYGFIVDDLFEDDFKRQFPKADPVNSDSFAGEGDEVRMDWMPGEKLIRVAEYIYKEFEPVELVLFSDGVVMKSSDATKEVIAQAEAAGHKLVKRRKSMVTKVCWAKMSGCQILEKGKLPGQYIPIIPIIGDELIVGGKRILEGIVRHAKDPQRMYNYWASNETETIALAPRAPFIGAEGQFEGHEQKWQTANSKNHAFLEYKPKTINNELAPPPTRNVFEPAVQAITQARMQSAEDLKATTGIYDAALGNRSNENSGVAIQRRNQQSQTSNFHIMDNGRRAIRHCGRICNEWIPSIYDTERTMRIIGEDGEESVVIINRALGKSDDGKSYDMSIGRFDVTADAGPSFATKRQEAQAAMIDFSKTIPNAAPLIMDLIAKNSDWPGNKEIAERLRKTLPPGMIDSKDDKKIPPEVQAQLEQMSQMVEQLTQQLHASSDEAERKTAELESKERIELAKLETQCAIELAKLESAEASTALKLQIANIEQQLQLRGKNEEIDLGNENAGLGPEQAASVQEQQPTGGLAPGPIMGV